MTALLITGMTGFVGGHFASQAGSVDLKSGGAVADLASLEQVCAAVAQARPDHVIHLAAQSSVAKSIEDPAATYRTNFDGTLNLLTALREQGFRGRMLYVGSGDVYGAVQENRLPVAEDEPLRPRNPYAVSKVAAEALCYQWSQTGPFEIVMARPFNHIGPGQAPHFAVADFARQILRFRNGEGEDRLMTGDIDATRDFTDVRDIVRAYTGLVQGGKNGETYNVCSGVERSLREIIADMFRASGVSMKIETDTERLRPSEQRRMRGSYAKLKSHTGWEPRVPWQQTLCDILDDWEHRSEA